MRPPLWTVLAGLFLLLCCLLGNRRKPNSERQHLDRWGAATPSICFKSNTIVFDDSGTIFASSLTGANRRAITSNIFARRPVLSPQCTRLAFAQWDGKFQRLWISNPDGSDAHQITSDAAVDEPLCFTSDETLLIFSRTKPELLGAAARMEIWTANLKVAPITVTRIGDGENVSSNLTVRCRSQFNSKKERSEVFVWTRQSKEWIYVAEGYSPRISGSGHDLAFLKPVGNGLYRVVIRDLLHESERQLPLPAAYWTPPEFIFDGRMILTRMPESPRDGPGGVFLIDLATLEVKQIPKIPGGNLPEMEER